MLSYIAERLRCRVRYSFGQKWKTEIGKQYFTEIIGLSLTTVSQSTRLTDKRTDGRTNGRTEFSSLYRVCIACSAEIMCDRDLSIGVSRSVTLRECRCAHRAKIPSHLFSFCVYDPTITCIVQKIHKNIPYSNEKSFIPEILSSSTS